MSEYDQTFDPKVVIGHSDLIFDFKIVIAIFHSKMNLPYIIMALGCLCGELELAPV